LLGEFDLELLVQVTLDTLIDAYVEDPGPRASDPARDPRQRRRRCTRLTALRGRSRRHGSCGVVQATVFEPFHDVVCGECLQGDGDRIPALAVLKASADSRTSTSATAAAATTAARRRPGSRAP
jgi:hypothetical protein